MSTADPTLPVFLYDGDCAFCSSCARFIDRRIPTEAGVVPWQWSSLDDLGVSPDEVDAAVVWVDDPAHHTAGPHAISDLLRSSTRPWWRAAGVALSPPPVRWIAGFGYRWVSRNRHRMPGGTAQCSLPRARRAPVGEAEPDT